MSPRLSRSIAVPALALLAAALVGGGVGAGAYAVFGNGAGDTTSSESASSVRPAAQTTSTALSVNGIYRRVSGGVVEITTTTGSSNSSPYPFGGGGSQQAQGSGFVYDTAGHVITNEHVVASADSITVRFANGSTYKATLVGSDASTDLAVLQVQAPQKLLQPLTLADSNDLSVGDGVVAIGSPFGLENTVTSGIVSALHRDIAAPNDFTIDDAIQTDAAINHGNSGGPLLDLLGRVIGITAQIKSSSGGNEGVGFAIPSNTIHSIASKLISTGAVEHAYLGVAVQTIPSGAATALGVPQGVEVTEVRSGTPAAGAGLKGAGATKTVNGLTYPTGGDVITMIDGQRVTSADGLRSLIDAKQPGDEITVTYVRSGGENTVHVTLTKRPS